MSRRKAFQAGQGAFLVADEFAEEACAGSAELYSAPTSRWRKRAHYAARGLANPILAVLVFSLAAMIAGIVVARVWR
jgi:hypothetical protein